MKIKMQKTALALSALFTGAVLIGTAQAAPIPITNADFETGTGTNIPGWTIGPNTFLVVEGSAFPLDDTTPTDSQFLTLDSRGTPAEAYQSVATILPNTVYTLTFTVGRRVDNAAPPTDFDAGLYAGVGALPTDALDIISLSDVTLSIGDPLEVVQVVFNSGVDPSFNGQNLFVRAVDTSPQGAGDPVLQTIFDDFALDAVPEPGSLALLGLGGLCLLARRRS